MRAGGIFALMRAAFVVFQNSAKENPLSARTADMYSEFLSGCKDDDFKLSHNGQVCYLRAALNAKFGNMTSGFFMVEDYVKDLTWLYAATEDENLNPEKEHIEALQDNAVTGHIYAPREAVMNDNKTFIIYVPSDLYNDEYLPKIKQFVNEYKLVTRVPQYEPLQ